MEKNTQASAKILTIIIPMYQSEAFIKKCLDSMLLDKAGMGRLEILVVNDGSKDRSAVLAEAYARRFPDSIRLINKENGGHGSAVNLGVKLCRGRFFKVVDADDWVCREGLRQILDMLLKPDAARADAVLAAYRIHNIRNKSTETVSCGRDAAGIWTGLCGVLRDWGRYRRLFTLHGLVYRTDFYRAQRLRLPEHVYYDDAYFDVVPAAHARRIYVTDTVFYEYRTGDENQSMSKRNREARLGELGTVLLKICRAQAGGRRLSGAGKRYWYRRTASFLADYYATALLRAENRRRGSAAARAFSHRMKQEDRKLWRMCRLKYLVLFFMHTVHMDGRQLEDFFRMREALRKRCSGKRNSGKNQAERKRIKKNAKG